MQFSVANAFNATAEVADAINHPLIRVFTVGQGGSFNDDTPLADFESIAQRWSVSTPASIGNGDFTYFSALCYFFARDLQEALGEPTVPIGAISSNCEPFNARARARAWAQARAHAGARARASARRVRTRCRRDRSPASP